MEINLSPGRQAQSVFVCSFARDYMGDTPQQNENGRVTLFQRSLRVLEDLQPTSPPPQRSVEECNMLNRAATTFLSITNQFIGPEKHLDERNQQFRGVCGADNIETWIVNQDKADVSAVMYRTSFDHAALYLRLSMSCATRRV